MSNETLSDALRDEPPPEWIRRPKAKDELRAKARELRAQGLAYDEIAAALGVSKSPVSLWVRDLPIPARLSYAECRKRSAEGARRYWEAERPVREARREAIRDEAAAGIGELTDRDVRRSADLYRRIEGWAGASMSARRPPGRAGEPLGPGGLPIPPGWPRPVSWTLGGGVP